MLVTEVHSGYHWGHYCGIFPKILGLFWRSVIRRFPRSTNIVWFRECYIQSVRDRKIRIRVWRLANTSVMMAYHSRSYTATWKPCWFVGCFIWPLLMLRFNGFVIYIYVYIYIYDITVSSIYRNQRRISAGAQLSSGISQVSFKPYKLH